MPVINSRGFTVTSSNLCNVAKFTTFEHSATNSGLGSTIDALEVLKYYLIFNFNRDF